MVIIRLTFNNGRVFYVNEDRKQLVLSESIKDAFQYRTTLEFKVSFKRLSMMEKPYSGGKTWLKEDVEKFEKVDPYTLKAVPFDVAESEVEISDVLYFDPTSFGKLMKCGITCSHWLYDKDDNWIAFPKENDYSRVVKIRYYVRGLIDTICSYSNWSGRYDAHSWHGCFEAHHTLMLHPIIQQLSLMGLDSCHAFTIYPIKD